MCWSGSSPPLISGRHGVPDVGILGLRRISDQSPVENNGSENSIAGQTLDCMRTDAESLRDFGPTEKAIQGTLGFRWKASGLLVVRWEFLAVSLRS